MNNTIREIRDEPAQVFEGPVAEERPGLVTNPAGAAAGFVMQALMTTLDGFSMMLGPPDPIRSTPENAIPKWIYAINDLDERVWCYAPDGSPSEAEVQATRNPDGLRKVHQDAPLYPDGDSSALPKA